MTTNPLIEQVRSRLREQAGSDYPVGAKLPPMRRLSDDFGCSLGVVQMAVNTLIAEGRLRSEPRKGVFVADQQALLRDVALVLPTLKLEAMDSIIRGVRNGLPEGRLQLVIHAADSDFDHQIDLLDHLDPAELAGVIICPPTSDEYAVPIQRFVERGVRVVQATHRLSAVRADTVVVDGFDLGRSAADVLVQHGHRKLALVGFSQKSHTARDIHSGVWTSLRNAGLNPDAMPHASLEGVPNDVETPWAASESALAEMLAAHPEVTAVLANSHHTAIGAVRAAQSLGRSIPDDLSIMAMGVDTPTLRLMQPGVTLMENPIEFICQRAASRLAQVLDDPSSPIEVIQLPPRLIERGSVSRPRFDRA